MRTGELAKEVGVSVGTVRLYEREGLLPRASRRANGYRDFPPAAAGRLRLVLACRGLGIPLAGIQAIFGKLRNQGESCAEVSDLIGHELHATTDEDAGFASSRARARTPEEVLRARTAG